MEQVLQLISQYGLSIVGCCVLCYMLYKQMIMHKEESIKWQKALDNNSQVLSNNTEVIKQLLQQLNKTK